MSAVIAAKIRCIKCKVERDFHSFDLKMLNEEAILVCPVCNAEMALTATLQGQPKDTDEFGMEPMSEPMPEPMSEPMPAPPPEREPESRKPVSLTRVLVCTKCNAEWLGHDAMSCPQCHSRKVMVSTKSITDRVINTFDEVLVAGLPIDHVVNKLLGHTGA